MKVLHVEPFGRDELLAKLATTRLMGFEKARVYAEATLDVVTAIDTDVLLPAQRYVLTPGVATILALRDALIEDHGIDLFALDGGLWVTTDDDPGARIPVLPPIVETSEEPDGRIVLLINDGIHRVAAARVVGEPISVVVVRGASHPYYALALEDGWADVQELEALPDSFQKKTYRMPDGYKQLFRDFNAVFPGVQAERKKSNPLTLRA